MLKLNLPTEPAWHDMPHGVRLLLRPASAAILTAAQIVVQQAIDAAAAALTEPMRLGLAIQTKAEALAAELVADWENVLDAEGRPLALTRERAALLMRSDERIMLSFLEAVMAPFERMQAEGNA